MKAVVNRILNVRQGRPSVNAPNPSYYLPGDQVEIVSSVIGDRYKDNNIWYRLQNDSYVWSGGVTTPDGEALPDLIQEFDFSKLLQFNHGIIVKPGGKDGVIAMLDSGVSHTSLDPKIIAEESFLPGITTPDDERGHGTGVAGILCGHDAVIKSLTPECSIVNYRVTRSNAVLTEPAMKALRALLVYPGNIDVLNLSLSVSSGTIPLVQPIVDQLLEKGTVTVVAAGNGNSVNTMARLKNVIRVGAIEARHFFSVKQEGLSTRYHCAFIDTPIPSTFLNDRHDYIHKVSAYTPIVSSIVLSCLKSSPAMQGRSRLTEAERFLLDATYPISTLQSAEEFKLMKP